MKLTLLALEGRLDSAAATKFKTGFPTKIGTQVEGGDKAIIDLQDLVYISSLVIRILIFIIKQFQTRSINLVTIRPRDNTKKELLVTVQVAQ